MMESLYESKWLQSSRGAQKNYEQWFWRLGTFEFKKKYIEFKYYYSNSNYSIQKKINLEHFI